MQQSNKDWILTNWTPGTSFQALAFAKHTKCESFDSCLNALENALSDISNLNLKKSTNSSVILWARKYKKKAQSLLDTTLVKQYFYLQTRKKLMVSKKYLTMTLKAGQIQNEIAMAEDLVQADNDTLQNVGNIDQRSDNEDSQSAYSDEPDERNFEFKKMFSKLKSEDKWYLSNGKCVDDELFIFGLQCESDHPSRSLIIDPYDSNYTTYNVFSQNELQEIINYQKKSLPTAPDSLKHFLNKYNKKTTAELRFALGKSHTLHADYNKDESFDEDWINSVVYSLVREYEHGNMARCHHEQWYQSHIWSMIESCFDKLENIEAVCGESASLGSKKRMNEGRGIESITKATRLRCGHKCDLIFRQYNIQHSISLEFGASEAKPTVENESGTNFMKEGFYKLPRALKDMLDNLLEEVKFDDRSTKIRTVGFIHSGLSSTLIQLDRPTKYISRISRCNTLVISNSVAQFGSTVLPVVLSTWVCCEMVKEVFEVVSEDNKEVDTNDLGVFDNFLEKVPLPAMPTTSTSTSTERAQKRLKK
ncbi:hypothetical protein BD408DRAFT_426326 [Parasitella parasitica]|nr:hypothetical protein BD408DRAFT_426326 [Parasitella parasitica]